MFTSCSLRLVVELSLVAPLPHICQLALPSSSTSCCVLFLSAFASCCVVAHQPATLQPPPSITSPAHGWLLCLPPALSSLIAVVLPLLTLRPCLPFCLSWASCLAGCCIASLSSGWLLHCLSSHHHLPSKGASTSHCALASHHAPLGAIGSCASSCWNTRWRVLTERTLT